MSFAFFVSSWLIHLSPDPKEALLCSIDSDTANIFVDYIRISSIWLQKFFGKVVSNAAIAFHYFTGFLVDAMRWDVVTREGQCCNRGKYPNTCRSGYWKVVSVLTIARSGLILDFSVANGK